MNKRARQSVTRSFLEKPLTFGCFRLVQRGLPAPLRVWVPFIPSQKPSGPCYDCKPPAECPRPRPLLFYVCAPGGGVAEMQTLHFYQAPWWCRSCDFSATFIISAECPTGKAIRLNSEGPGSSPSYVMPSLSKPWRNHLAALWLSFSFCKVRKIINN